MYLALCRIYYVVESYWSYETIVEGKCKCNDPMIQFERLLQYE